MKTGDGADDFSSAWHFGVDSPRILVRLGAFEMNKPVPFDIVLLVISAARCSGNPHKVSLRLSASFVAASAQSTMIDIWRLKKDYNAY